MCCKALGVHKSTYHHRKTTTAPQRKVEEDQRVVDDILTIIEEDSNYGYRPLLHELRDEPYNQVINHKRLRRILNDYELSLHRSVSKPPPSDTRRIINENKGKVDLVKGREFEILEVFSTDFTELKYRGGKAQLMALIDIESKWVAGWAVGPSANTELALECWKMARQNIKTYRPELEGLIVHSDKDSVYTGNRWVRQLIVTDHVRLSFSENGCRDNPWVESFWSRMKDDWHSRIVEAETLEEIQLVIGEWVEYYNQRRRHSTIGYLSPITFLTQQLKEENTGRA